MPIQRFSAIGNFGVPIDNVDDLSNPESLVNLLGAYGIEGQDIPVDTIDITPYYWQKPTFRYLMTRNSKVSPVEVDMMPIHADSKSYASLGHVGIRGFALTPERKIIVPINQEMMAIAGPGPRFPGQICVHEVVAEI